MNRHRNRFILALLIFMLPHIHGTNAYFTDTETISGSTITTSCWTPPAKPELLTPLYDVHYYAGSPWLSNPVFDWADSATTCPTETVSYQISVYHDRELTERYYQSNWLPSSEELIESIPNGTYFWQVVAKDSAGNISQPSAVWKFSINRSRPEFIPQPNPGDVVINEIMWMGSSGKSGDEWIELRNTTDHEISLSKMEIRNAKARKNQIKQPYIFSPSSTIPAHGYIVIANYPRTSSNTNLNIDPYINNASLSFANEDNGHLILITEEEVVIDQALGNPWPQGSNSDQKRSMQRDLNSGDGLNTTSWHTCDVDECGSTAFWKTANQNFGTPGSENRYHTDLPPTSMSLQNENIITPIETALTVNLDKDNHQAVILLSGNELKLFTAARYTLNYKDSETDQQVIGSFSIDQNSAAAEHTVTLGTCSTGGTCVYPVSISDLNANVILENDTIQRILTYPN